MSSNFIKVFTQNFESSEYDIVSYVNLSTIVVIETNKVCPNAYFIKTVNDNLKFTVISEELTTFLNKAPTKEAL